jgi:hypothetical protein
VQSVPKCSKQIKSIRSKSVREPPGSIVRCEARDGNPGEGERPPLKVAVKQRSVKNANRLR